MNCMYRIISCALYVVLFNVSVFADAVTSIPISVTNVDPMGTLAGFSNAGPEVCGTFGAMSNYGVFEFKVNETGSYEINLMTANPVVSIFTAANYDPSMPCSGATFIASNFNSSTGSATSIISNINLEACIDYIMVVWATPLFNGTAQFSSMDAEVCILNPTDDCPAQVANQIPTMGQWALFVMTLLLLSLGLISIKKKMIVRS